MKKILLIFFSITVNICFSQDYHRFSENEEVFLFGDNVKLRKSPNINSETLKLLPIGTKVKVKKATDIIYEYKGFSSPWHLIDYNGTEGYIVGGLISLKKHKSFYDSNGFFLYNLSKDDSNHLNSVNIRFIQNTEIISEVKIRLFGNGSFEILNYDNRGLENVKDIIVIDNYSEACGIDGGKSYIIFNGENLIPMANTSEIGDGGIYHYESNFTFPSDEGGKKGVVIYNQESGEEKDEESNWYITTSQKRNLIWNGTELIPNDYNKEK